MSAVPKVVLGCRYPTIGSQCETLLKAFYRGERLTVLVAVNRYGVFALSQRCGDLRRLGWPVQSRIIETRNGARVAEYWMRFQ